LKYFLLFFSSEQFHPDSSNPLPKDINSLNDFEIWLQNAKSSNRSMPNFTNIRDINFKPYSEVIVKNLQREDNLVPILVMDAIQSKNDNFVYFFSMCCLERLKKMMSAKEPHSKFEAFMNNIEKVYRVVVNDFTPMLLTCLKVIAIEYKDRRLGTLLAVKVLSGVRKKLKIQNAEKFYSYGDIFFSLIHNNLIIYKNEQEVKVITDFIEICNDRNDKIYTLEGSCNPSLRNAVRRILQDEPFTFTELTNVCVHNIRDTAKFFFHNAARSYEFNRINPVKFVTFLKDWKNAKSNNEKIERFIKEVVNSLKISFHAQHISKDPNLPENLKIGTAVLIKEFYQNNLISIYDMETFVKTLICHEMTNGNGLQSPVYKIIVKSSIQLFHDRKESLADFVSDTLRWEDLFNNNNVPFDRNKWVKKSYEHMEWKKKQIRDIENSKDEEGKMIIGKKRSSSTGTIPKK
jgi:hypothetical protein